MNWVLGLKILREPSTKGWACDPKLGHFRCRQQLGRPSNSLGGNSVHLNPCCNQGKLRRRLQNMIKTLLTFTQHNKHIAYFSHCIKKIGIFTTNFYHDVDILTLYCCSPHPPRVTRAVEAEGMCQPLSPLR